MDNHPDNLAIYDASWGSWLDMKRYGPASRWLRSLIGDACAHMDRSPDSIHDVGCGEGTNTLMLAERYPQSQVHGSDFSATAIAVAQRHCSQSNLTFTHAPENRAVDYSADLVCCFEVLEHVDDWRSFLSRLASAANRHLLLSFPTGRMRPFEVNVGHMRNFAKGEVEAELALLGFRPANLSYAGFPFYSPLYREFCQLTNAGAAQFTRGTYGPARKLVSTVLYTLFRFTSTQRRHGDQFVGLFVRNEP
ncbi:MAG: class I SAM-dependent methyltransferase [Dokdonella sp.]